MIQNVLVILIMITSLSIPAGFAFSANLQKKETQQENSVELRTEKPATNKTVYEDRELMFHDNFFNEVERFLENQLPGTWDGWKNPRYWRKPLLGSLLDRQAMPVDVIEQERNFLIKAELPGVDKKDIHITVSDNMVTIEADTSEEEMVEKSSYYRREISRGAYRRTLMLPVTLDSSEAKASFTNGVLQLTIPKVAETKSITIEVE